MGEDIGALYEQQLSRRVLAVENAADKRLNSVVTLYFPLSAVNGIMAEARNVAFPSMEPSDMAVKLLEEIASGAAVVKGSPAMPMLPNYLTEAPAFSQPAGVSGSLVTLRFNAQLDDMLLAAGVSRASLMAAICYTFTTFLPNVGGLEAYVDDERIDHVMLGSTSGILFDDGVQRRADYAELLMDNCTLYFADAAGQKLVAVRRPIAFYQTANARALLKRAVQRPFGGGQRAGRAGDHSRRNAERFRYHRNLSGWGRAACELFQNVSGRGRRHHRRVGPAACVLAGQHPASTPPTQSGWRSSWAAARWTGLRTKSTGRAGFCITSAS